jgi:hypothetical protein
MKTATGQLTQEEIDRRLAAFAAAQGITKQKSWDELAAIFKDDPIDDALEQVMAIRQDGRIAAEEKRQRAQAREREKQS